MDRRLFLFALFTLLAEPSWCSWVAGPPASSDRVFHSAAALQDGRVLAAGGGSPAELFDASSGAWTAAGAMGLEDRRMQAAALLPDGRVLFTGGWGEASSAAAESELYDPVSGKFAAAAPMGRPRVLHTATLLPNGKVLTVGGLGVAGSTDTADNAELYDPASGEWSPAGALEPRSSHAAALLPDGRVLVSGGEVVDGRTSRALDVVSIFDPASGQWSEAASMPSPRAGHSALLLADGKVLAVGGYGGSFAPEEDGRVPLKTAELYDPSAGVWTTVSSRVPPGLGATASLLPDGKVLLAGGEAEEAAVLDPLTGEAVSAGPTLASRAGHTATALADGRVLFVGGEGRTTEWYDPGAAWPAPRIFSLRPAGGKLAVVGSHFLPGTVLRVGDLELPAAVTPNLLFAELPVLASTGTLSVAAYHPRQGLSNALTLRPRLALAADAKPAAAADLEHVRVYPNPFVPNGGDPDQGVAYTAGNPDSGIVFDNLMQDATVRVYTLVGSLVRELPPATATGRLQWDARNDGGQEAASGVYFAVIRAAGAKTAVKKLMVVR